MVRHLPLLHHSGRALGPQDSSSLTECKQQPVFALWTREQVLSVGARPLLPPGVWSPFPDSQFTSRACAFHFLLSLKFKPKRMGVQHPGSQEIKATLSCPFRSGTDIPGDLVDLDFSLSWRLTTWGTSRLSGQAGLGVARVMKV